MNFSPYPISVPLPANPPLILNTQSGQFLPMSNFMDDNQQLVAPPGYSFVAANILPVQNSINTMQYLNIQQHIQHQSNQPSLQKRKSNCQTWNSASISSLQNNNEIMQISQIGAVQLVARKASKFIYLEKHEKEFLKGQLVENAYLSLQNIFHKAGCLVGKIEGKGYVTKFKIYKFKDLHYAQAMFELIVEHIQIEELTMSVDMKKGRFYRYGINIELVVAESDIDALTETLQLLNLRPIFFKGEALNEESSLGLWATSIEKNRSRPVEFDCDDIEPRGSNRVSPQKTTDLVDKTRRSFSCLSINIDGEPMHLDIKITPEDTAKISHECLDRLRRSVSKSLSICNDVGIKSLSMEEFTTIYSNSSGSSGKQRLSSLSSKSLHNISGSSKSLS